MQIQKAILYGSFANNTANAESDIDVLLVSSKFDESSIEKRAETWLYTIGVDSRIEPFSIGLKNFLSENDSPLLAEIKKSGVEIPI